MPIIADKDFRRIAALLRRDLPPALSIPGLLPKQQHALGAALEAGGLLSHLPVGAGKTPITFMLPAVLGSERWLLLVPAALRDKTRTEYKKYCEWWELPPLHLAAYEDLSSASRHAALLDPAPDLIIADEAHNLKRASSARTKTLAQFFKKNPRTRFCALSGTLIDRSVSEVAHLAAWALGEGSPLPLEYMALRSWCGALDAKVKPKDRCGPGALLRLPGAEGSGTPLERARRAYAKRLAETPGVYIAGADEIPVCLQLEALTPPLSANARSALERLRSDWVLPDGQEVMLATEWWLAARTLPCGFFFRWRRQPPSSWLAARRAWAQRVDRFLSYNKRDLVRYSEAKRELAGCPELAAWEAIEPLFDVKKERVVEWLGPPPSLDWARRGPTLVWVEHTELGRKLSEVNGIPYYGTGELSALEKHSDTCIVSMGAFGEGVNLQRYSRSLLIEPPAGLSSWEQVIGRTHRRGQSADMCEVAAYFYASETFETFNRMLEEVDLQQDMMRSRPKVLLGDWIWDANRPE